jgi:N-acetylgalactosamine-N,N'-diacetylbacillosaminyl-diphospho-undecaprenol 4-alpha-N-acetylgalactosaminyltransferase
MNVILKKKVALLINNLNPGGCERTAAFLLNHYAENIEWYLLMFSDEIHYPIPGDIKLKIIDFNDSGWKRIMFPIQIQSAAIKLKLFLQQENIDQLITFNHLPASLAGRLKLSGWNGSWLLTEQIHCSTYINSGKSWLKKQIKRREIKKYYPLSDKIIANATGITQDLYEHFGIPINKLMVIGNPVDFPAINQQKNEPLPQETANREFIFIHVGRYEPQKNHRLLVDSFSKANIPDSKLWLIGNGSGYAEIERHIQAIGLQKSIIQWGIQSNPFKFLAKAHAFVLSSDYEGFPNVLLEAMACGLPVISTNCKSGPAELVSPKEEPIFDHTTPFKICEYGILTRVGDADSLSLAMRHISKNKDLASGFAKKAPERLKPFDSEEVLRQFKALIFSTTSYLES